MKRVKKLIVSLLTLAILTPLSGCENLNDKISVSFMLRPREFKFNIRNQFKQVSYFKYTIQNQSQKALKADDWYFRYGIISQQKRMIHERESSKLIESLQSIHSEEIKSFDYESLPQGNYTAFFELYLDEKDAKPFKKIEQNFTVYVD